VTRHAYTPFMLLFSKPIWDTLSSTEQEILRDCAIVGRDVQRSVSRELSDESRAKLEEVGMEINELSAEEQARMRERAQPVYERHADSIGQDVIDRMMSALEEIRSE
jgi:TRAP-type C4-dicarboxylate transport system substrate-binding protein